MDRIELERRTKVFALDVVKTVIALRAGSIRDTLGRQVLRSATSVGANYREANRAESKADFVHKLGIVEKELAETEYWLELLKECGAVGGVAADRLLVEVGELLRIFNKSARTSRASLGR